MTIPTLTDIKLLQKTKTITLSYDNGESYELPCGFFRANSPSASERGHGPRPAIKTQDLPDCNIVSIEPVGHYAIKLSFTDGHDTGIYSFEYLYELTQNYLK